MNKYLSQLQENILKSFNKHNSKLNIDVIKNFINWKFSFNKIYPMDLTIEGENELIDLSERMQARFPTLFPEFYNKDLFKVN